MPGACCYMLLSHFKSRLQGKSKLFVDFVAAIGGRRKHMEARPVQHGMACMAAWHDPDRRTDSLKLRTAFRQLFVPASVPGQDRRHMCPILNRV